MLLTIRPLHPHPGPGPGRWLRIKFQCCSLGRAWAPKMGMNWGEGEEGTACENHATALSPDPQPGFRNMCPSARYSQTKSHSVQDGAKGLGEGRSRTPWMWVCLPALSVPPHPSTQMPVGGVPEHRLCAKGSVSTAPSSPLSFLRTLGFHLSEPNFSTFILATIPLLVILWLGCVF